MTVLAWPAIVAKAGAARRAAWLWFRFAARFGLLIPVSIGVGLVFGNDAALKTMVVLVVLGIALMPFLQAADEAAEERPVFDGFPTIRFFWLLHRARHRVRVMDPYLHLLARPAQLNQAAARYQVLAEAICAPPRRIVFIWLLRRAARRGVEVEVLLTHPNSDYYLPATARRILYTTGVRYRRSILDGLAVLGALRDRLPVAAGDRLAVRIVHRLPQHSYYLADDQVLMSYAQPEDRPTFRARWHFHHSEDPIAQMAAFEFEAGWELADGFGFVEQFGTELPAASCRSPTASRADSPWPRIRSVPKASTGAGARGHRTPTGRAVTSPGSSATSTRVPWFPMPTPARRRSARTAPETRTPTSAAPASTR